MLRASYPGQPPSHPPPRRSAVLLPIRRPCYPASLSFPPEAAKALSELPHERRTRLANISNSLPPPYTPAFTSIFSATAPLQLLLPSQSPTIFPPTVVADDPLHARPTLTAPPPLSAASSQIQQKLPSFGTAPARPPSLVQNDSHRAEIGLESVGAYPGPGTLMADLELEEAGHAEQSDSGPSVSDERSVATANSAAISPTSLKRHRQLSGSTKKKRKRAEVDGRQDVAGAKPPFSLEQPPLSQSGLSEAEQVTVVFKALEQTRSAGHYTAPFPSVRAAKALRPLYSALSTAALRSSFPFQPLPPHPLNNHGASGGVLPHYTDYLSAWARTEAIARAVLAFFGLPQWVEEAKAAHIDVYWDESQAAIREYIEKGGAAGGLCRMLEYWGYSKGWDFFPSDCPLYFRLKAHLPGPEAAIHPLNQLALRAITAYDQLHPGQLEVKFGFGGTAVAIEENFSRSFVMQPEALHSGSRHSLAAEGGTNVSACADLALTPPFTSFLASLPPTTSLTSPISCASLNSTVALPVLQRYGSCKDVGQVIHIMKERLAAQQDERARLREAGKGLASEEEEQNKTHRSSLRHERFARAGLAPHRPFIPPRPVPFSATAPNTPKIPVAKAFTSSGIPSTASSSAPPVTTGSCAPPASKLAQSASDSIVPPRLVVPTS
ncbi:hypothetical protein JCM11641_007987 [Rhodosporidiobolus odoratus]